MVTLRILTRKSRIGVGTYANETVQKLLDLKKHRALRRLYYRYEAITFQDDILDDIRAEIRIPKPGVDHEAEGQVNDMMDLKILKAAKAKDGKERFTMTAAVKARKKDDRIREANARRGSRLTKGRMQAANHGHMYIDVKDDD